MSVSANMLQNAFLEYLKGLFTEILTFQSLSAPSYMPPSYNVTIYASQFAWLNGYVSSLA